MRLAPFLLILTTTLTMFFTIPASPYSVGVIPAAGLGTTDYPWAMYRYDAIRSGASPTTSPGSTTLMWTKVTAAAIYGSPAVADGMVFVPSWDGNLYAVDEYSGLAKWTFSASPIYASPAVANGVVYLGSTDGQVYAIDESSGATLWSTNNPYNNPGNPIASSLLVADGRVFFGTYCAGTLCNPPGHFEALNATTGSLLWLDSASAAVISSPSVDNGKVFYGADDGTVQAVNETTGRQIWSSSAGSTIRSAIAVGNGRLYIGTWRAFIALSELTGSQIWSFNTNNVNATSPAVNGGVVYFGTGRGNIYAVNATTGVQKWGPATTSGAVNSSPALALGSKTLLVGSNDHYLYAFNMTTGARLWRYSTGGPVSSSPAVADGRVFFGSQDSVFYALGAKIPQLHVTISAAKTSLLPGQVSNLTIRVTDGTNPVNATLTLTSTTGGGLTQPWEQTLGTYESNYTAPLVTTTTTTTLQVTASAPGALDGSSQTSVLLNPYPSLNVFVTAKPSSVNPGGSLQLLILVENGTLPISGATISLSSNQGGTFSDQSDMGNGTYSATFSTEIQSTNPTLTVQASKSAFSPGQAQITIAIAGIGIPDLTKGKAFGVPIWLLGAGVLAILLMSLMAMVASRRKSRSNWGSYDKSYAVRSPILSRMG